VNDIDGGVKSSKSDSSSSSSSSSDLISLYKHADPLTISLSLMSLNRCWRGVDGLRLIPKADVRIGVDKQAIIVAADSADPFILLALMGLRVYVPSRPRCSGVTRCSMCRGDERSWKRTMHRRRRLST
jgi:hypothetical protein